MSKDGKIWLSHTGIETLERCPRCFWLLYHKGIRQPEGIVSRLANRFDKVVKNYFNIYRGKIDLPPLVQGKLPGKLQNPFQEKYFHTVNDKYGFWGKLDECLVDENDQLIPVDFKTSSSDPRQKETLSAYQSQIDAYLYLLKQNENKIQGVGYLVYLYPEEGEELHIGFPMTIHVVKLAGKPERAAEKIKKAINILEKEMPEENADCVFCKWYKEVNKHLLNKKQEGKQLALI